MLEIIEQTAELLDQSQGLLENPAIKTSLIKLTTWMTNKLFNNKKSSKEKLELIEQKKADTDTIASIKANLEFVLDNNEKLSDELFEKTKELRNLIKENNPVCTKTIIQTHNGIGDNIGGDKIAK